MARIVQGTVLIGGVSVPWATVAIANRLDAVARCTITLPQAGHVNLPGGLQDVVVSLGSGVSPAQRFKGTTRADSPAYRPYANALVALGPKNALSEGAPRGAVFRSLYDPATGTITVPFTDTDLVTALCALAGLASGQYSISGAGQALASRVPIVVGRGAGELAALVKRADDLLGWWTADQASGIVTRRADPRYAATYGTPLGTYAESPSGGDRPLLNPISRPRDTLGVLNGHIVLGYVYQKLDPTSGAPDPYGLYPPGGGLPVYWNRPHAAYSATSPWVKDGSGADMVRWAQAVQDNWIETTALADLIAAARQYKENKLRNAVQSLALGATDLDVGQVWNLRSADMEMAGGLPHLLVGLDESATPSSYTVRQAWEGLTGSLGAAVDPLPGVSATFSGGVPTASIDVAITAPPNSAGPFNVTAWADTSGATVTAQATTTASLTFPLATEQLPATIYVEVEDVGTRLRNLASGIIGGGP